MAERVVLALVLLVLYQLTFSLISSWRKNVKVPSVGSTWAPLIWSLAKNKENVLEGYKKHPNSFFKVSIFPFGSTLVANGSQLADEIRNGPNDVFNMDVAGEKSVQAQYTAGIDPARVHYEIPLIRNTLTRNLAGFFGDLVDEMEHAFDEVMQLPQDGEWKALPVLDTVNKIVARTSNRVFVGLPLCRNETYHQIALDYVSNTMTSAFIIGLFPEWTHPVTGRLFGKPYKSVRRIVPLLQSMIEERRNKLNTYGKEWTDRPNDFLMWFIENAPPGIEQTIPALCRHVLGVNFVAIQTTGMAFTQALYNLATYPQYVRELHNEARTIVDEFGWSKASMQKMRKADSFLRESARLNPVGLVALTRLVEKDHTFSDGTFVPKGNWIAASSYSLHMDDNKYPDASTFKPWRFSDIRYSDEAELTKHQLVATSTDFLAFGAGKHACPGRFFAANELKAMLSYVVLNYDVKLMPESEGKRPENEIIGVHIMPNRKAKLMFRLKEGRK